MNRLFKNYVYVALITAFVAYMLTCTFTVTAGIIANAIPLVACLTGAKAFIIMWVVFTVIIATFSEVEVD